jgi:hypothetical protein
MGAGLRLCSLFFLSASLLLGATMIREPLDPYLPYLFLGTFYFAASAATSLFSADSSVLVRIGMLLNGPVVIFLFRFEFSFTHAVFVLFILLWLLCIVGRIRANVILKGNPGSKLVGGVRRR